MSKKRVNGDGGAEDTQTGGNDQIAEEATTTTSFGGDFDVIVIGAGFAGLGAATKLQEAGKTVLVLEATEWTGGRVRGVHLNGHIVDGGAMWMKGLNGNPLQELIDEAGVKIENYDHWEAGEDGMVYDEKTGDSEPYADFAKYTKYLVGDLDYYLEEAGGAGTSGRDGLNVFLEEFDDDKEKRIALCTLEQNLMGLTFAANADDISLESLQENEDYGKETVVFPGSYSQLTDFLADSLDNEVRNQHPVTDIDHSIPDTVKVTAKDVANGNQVIEFTASRVVVTVSVGVLQSGIINFNPPLPQTKTDAIGNVKMGTAEKVIMQFKEGEKFWDEAIAYVGENLEESIAHYYDFAFAYDLPTLTAWIPAGSNLERSAFTNKAMEQLRKIYGDNIPDPQAIWVSDWKTNEYFQGCYSFVPTWGSSEDMERLGDPVGRIHFSGEATHKELYGYTHGALESGYRAAKEIIES